MGAPASWWVLMFSSKTELPGGACVEVFSLGNWLVQLCRLGRSTVCGLSQQGTPGAVPSSQDRSAFFSVQALG